MRSFFSRFALPLVTQIETLPRPCHSPPLGVHSVNAIDMGQCYASYIETLSLSIGAHRYADGMADGVGAEARVHCGSFHAE